MPRFRFADCEIDSSRRLLRRSGREVAVQPKVMDLLIHLIEQRDRVVSTEELHRAVWPDATVTRSALSRCVVKARRAIGDTGERQRSLRTVHGRGFRFVAEVERVSGLAGQPAPEIPATVPSLAKLTPPPLRGLVVRPRLIDMLDRAAPAVWIQGPPGSGKTSLARSYAQATDAHLAWFEIDPRDADPAVFFHQLGLLRQRLQPGGTDPPAFGPQYYLALTEFARRRFEDFFLQTPRPLLFVLDDVHQLPDGAQTIALLSELLASLPSRCRLLFTSRSRPPGELARERVNRRLDLLRASDLRLTRSEAGALLSNQGMRLDPETRARSHRAGGGLARRLAPAVALGSPFRAIGAAASLGAEAGGGLLGA